MKAPKLKKCKSCGTMFPPWSSLTRVCGMACALDHAGKEQQTKKQKKLSERKREFLKNDLRHQKKRAQTNFNAYIRERDARLGCVSCDKGSDWQGQFHAGHYKTTGSRPDLRFNENNCQKQCSICNHHLSGNVGPYRVELIRRIGLEAVEALETEGEPPRYRAEDYRRIADEYRDKLKALKARDI